MAIQIKPPASGDPWKALDYEFEMYFETQKTLAAMDLGPSTLKNAYVESFLLHNRILADFLLNRGDKSDDIKLENLMPDVSTPALKENQVKLREAYGSNREPWSPCWTLNKLLAHLTTFRTSSFDWHALLNAFTPPLHCMLIEIAKETKRPVLMHYLWTPDE